MEQKVIICHHKGLAAAALTIGGRIAEIHYSTEEQSFALGDIYIGKVKQILPSIHGAFVEIGRQEECYFSMEEKYPPVFTARQGKKPLCVGDELLVQIQKEAVRTKKPVVTGNLNFTGKYAVLTSGNQLIGVSSKIGKQKKEVLLIKAEVYRGRGYGLILRTNAADAPWDLVAAEIGKLEDTLRKVTEHAQTRTCYSCLWRSPKPYTTLLRDMRQQALSEIVVEQGSLYDEVHMYLEQEQPEDIRQLRCYSDSSYPLDKCYGFDHTLEEALRDRVWLSSGAYLVIQETEAMHVIDVNSGKCMKKKKEILDINKEAAAETARQIRLRNLSGIIMVDFINLDSEEKKKELLSFFQKELNQDTNPGNVIDMTKLQIVEVTRKKIRKTLRENFYEQKRSENECNEDA